MEETILMTVVALPFSRGVRKIRRKASRLCRSQYVTVAARSRTIVTLKRSHLRELVKYRFTSTIDIEFEIRISGDSRFDFGQVEMATNPARDSTVNRNKYRICRYKLIAIQNYSHTLGTTPISSIFSRRLVAIYQYIRTLFHFSYTPHISPYRLILFALPYFDISTIEMI